MKEFLLEFEYPIYQNFESKNKDKKNKKKSKGHHKKDDTDEKKHSSDESEDYRMIENQIEDFFDRDGVDIAPYAYKLFGTKPKKNKDTNEMKNARSLFYKKLHHEENSEGFSYSFTLEELIHLQSLISDDSSLSENKKYDFFKRIVEGYKNNKYLIG